MRAAKPLKGSALVTALKKKFAPKAKSKREVYSVLHRKLGYSSIQFYNWQTRDSLVRASQIANLVYKAQQTAQKMAIRPIVEFFDFSATNEKFDKSGKSLKKYKKYELFRSDNTYERGLKDELENENGVYIFYDSRGRALYAGKASKQNLWREMNSALNRERAIQTIKKVRHPQNNVAYRTSDEKKRQISARQAKLYEMASFLSAYQVSAPVIGVFEAMLVRSFANDLLNVRMEQFAPPTKKRVRDRNRTGRIR